MRTFESPEEYFRARGEGGETASRSVRERVEKIVERVRREGDSALIDLTWELDSVRLGRDELVVSREHVARLAAKTAPGFRSVLTRARDNIRRFHERQVQSGFEIADPDGTSLRQRFRPLENAGVYVPGGEAIYPSTVLMNVVPAQIAGVVRIAVATPPGAIERSAELACALDLLGLDEIYRVGGAQAVAALAYGTETVKPVVKIVGPGNAYVAEAKRLVFGRVGIDAIAGPSEIAVLADETADPRYVAADLLSQAEHGSGDERAILVTTSRTLGQGVLRELEIQSKSLPRREAIDEVLGRHGAVVLAASLDEAIEAIDRIAPEHLEVLTRDADAVAERVGNAGAIFVGPWSPVPIGDFYAGPNHVLPTGATARFASPLGVQDFVKRASIVRYSRSRLERDRADIETFARVEGFDAHARAVAVRFEP